MAFSTYDFIIVGGGTAGSVVASRLQEKLPNASVVLIEAGQDASGHPLVNDIKNAPRLVKSEFDWDFYTVPQRHLNNRVLQNAAGKALGGGTAINSCGWIRGDASDYDLWARLVKDSRWSYSGLLPYFRMVEHYHTRDVDTKEHGFEGPIHTQSISSTHRDYPLRDQLRAAWASTGSPLVADANSGHPQGLSELIENRRDGLRQVASSVYPLGHVEVKSGTSVHRILLEQSNTKPAATGVQLSNGETLLARKEVIVSAGAYRTPQLLLLSGIGPPDDLANHNITVKVDAPGVGKNLFDHMAVPQWWKLRNPQAGLAAGASNFLKPSHAKGTPVDWMVTQGIPPEGLKNALIKDGEETNYGHPLLASNRSFTESFVVYAAANSENPTIPLDGSHITSTVLALLPTSRGSVVLTSSDPDIPPLIDPNYNATEADRYVTRTALRKMMEVLLDTKEGQAIIQDETIGEGQKLLTSTSSDQELDERIKERGKTLYHPAGTSAMGSVVDSEMRVYGIDRLRIVDASVIPAPIAGHLQVAVYALAEQAADIIRGQFTFNLTNVAN